MKIGIDFDNTIISYENLFYDIALAKGLINKEIKPTKISVRNFLRSRNQDYIFTGIQAEVYGPLIKKAKVFPNIQNTLNRFSQEHKFFIVSHKTRNPYIGPKYNLHKYASDWLKSKSLHPSIENSPIKELYFEETIEKKIERIDQLECDFFIDDLPKVLKLLKKEIKPILFDPNYENLDNFPKKYTMNNWEQLFEFIKN
tara:strand:+ start:32 stop:628 length:597 start_codon:yes stop_codon:yes gene_type:complete